jgi:hypothetical protein
VTSCSLDTRDRRDPSGTPAEGSGNDAPVKADISPYQLRILARNTASLRVALRIRAVAHLLTGASIEEAAASAHVRTRTLRNWIARYNAEGVEGLADRPRTLSRPD